MKAKGEKETMAKFWFTSDLHFGRKSFFEEGWGSRPQLWDSAEEMNEGLIDNWNSVVAHNDVVFIVGDFSDIDNSIENMRIWNRLNGKKTLILGNHDTNKQLSPTHFPMGKLAFPSCTSITVNGWEIFMSHYPTLEWKNKWKWNGNERVGPHAIHLYGHVHNRQMEELAGERAYNVCTDINDFTPISLESILKRLNLTS